MEKDQDKREEYYARLSSEELLALHHRGDPVVDDDALWQALVTSLSPEITAWTESVEPIDEVHRVFLALWRFRQYAKPWPFWMRLYTEIRMMGEAPPNIQRFWDVQREDWPQIWLPYWEAIGDALYNMPLLWALLFVSDNFAAVIVFAATADKETLRAVPQVGERLTFAMFNNSKAARKLRSRLNDIANFSNIMDLRRIQRVMAMLKSAKTPKQIIDVVQEQAKEKKGVPLLSYIDALKRVKATAEEQQEAAIAYVRASKQTAYDSALMPPLSAALRSAIYRDDVEGVRAALEEGTYEPADVIRAAQKMEAKKVERYVEEYFDPDYAETLEKRELEEEYTEMVAEMEQEKAERYYDASM